jgi:serine/threonine protein kinase
MAKQSEEQSDTLLSQQMENEGVDAELIDFVMRMLELDPEKRVTARDALRHEWLLGPLLGYWAALGVEWNNPEIEDRSVRRMNNALMTGESVETKSSSPKPLVSPPPRAAPLGDFSAQEEEEEDKDEVFQFHHPDGTPVKPEPQMEILLEPDDQVYSPLAMLMIG